MSFKRTPVKEKVKELLEFLVDERPDYYYLRSVFRGLRKELSVEVITAERKTPNVPTEEEIQEFYNAVWESKNFQDMMIIKMLLYTGLRVSELINIRIGDVDSVNCKIRITEKRTQKDRYVPFPTSFREVLGMHIQKMQKQRSVYLFEPSKRKKGYSDRGIRKILEKYTRIAGITRRVSPQVLRHFLIAWLKKNKVDDALIQPYSGHQRVESLDVYSKVDFKDAKEAYDTVINGFPV